jgi:uncharacterized protein YndB with AHSA1/START domain
MAETYELQTSVVIDAPASRVFDTMLDLNQFDAWNPFPLMDPTSVGTVTQTKPGVGSAYEYQGKRLGKGRQVVTEVVKPQLIVSEMTFLNRKTEVTRVEYRIEQQTVGTLVTWYMSGTRSWGQRVMVTLLNLDKMMGKHFSEGLERLKEYVEAGA